jgi:hypothetical protein
MGASESRATVGDAQQDGQLAQFGSVGLQQSSLMLFEFWRLRELQGPGLEAQRFEVSASQLYNAKYRMLKRQAAWPQGVFLLPTSL